MPFGDAPLNWTALCAFACGAVVVVLSLVAYAYLPGWWRRRSSSKGLAYGRGDTAIRARTMKSRAEAERDALARHCKCGAKLVGPLPESAWSAVALGDATISVARVPCACGAAVRRYYVLPR